MLAEDPCAPHFITVASSLHPEEMADITNGVKRFPLKPGGQVHVYFNPCFPVVSPVTDTAEALLCDFRGVLLSESALMAFWRRSTAQSYLTVFPTLNS
jgi:hypothetical protein